MARSNYEARRLKDAHDGAKRAKELMLRATDAPSFATYSRALDRWIERERVLLRIRLPGSEPPGAVKDVPKQPVVYTDIAPSAAHVMTEQPAPVVPSPSTPPKQ